MSQPICHIAGAGAFGGRHPRVNAGDLVIAADGGYEALVKRHIAPHVLIGDFDSLRALPQKTEDAPQIIRHPVEKDDTDMALSIEHGLSRGYKIFYIYGGTGKRLDHTLANIQLLAHLARQGARGYLFANAAVVTAIADGEFVFPAHAKGTVSIFAHGGDARGVTLTGLQYPLRDATLRCDNPLGVSNAFTGLPARATVREGVLIIFWEGVEV